ncbi:HNH endonuclease signature motif containing protein [Rhodococcus sp. MEB064]|uniref:HNH endonuclease signature motif containing protein n=1 Tax=Rhodococcus sp. MEB064 TaxID=1587522 RepID=UPI000696C6C4|nr:HNH endonuclease signature motif containing protein [Rhodococcus sp. MEB064]
MFSGGNAGAGRRDDGSIGDPVLAQLIAEQEELTRRIAAYGTQHLDTADRLALLVRDEKVTRARLGQAHVWLAELVQQRGFEETGARNADALALLLTIDRSAASTRLALAAQLGNRTTLLGDVMEPELPTTAAALREGAIDPAHVTVIRKFDKNLPAAVDADTRAHAERHLATAAREVRPAELTALAERLTAHIVEEGEFELPPERVRKRGIIMNKQGSDGMRTGRFVLDSETAAYMDAYNSKYAARGVGNPEDTRAPVVGTDPDDETRRRDTRTTPQRRHDALKLLLRDTLSSDDLGKHRGVPVKVIIVARLVDLLRGAGLATTATGSTVSIRDVIRMGSHADHYLAVFGDDDGRPLHFGRTRRIASEDQRLVLMATDRGCTAPGCDRPAVATQAHHIHEWQDGGPTDIESLTFVCDMHHPMIHDGALGWSTTTAPPGHPYAGRTLWHPPALIDPSRTGRVNHFHHPQDYLWEDDEPAA